MVTTATEPSGRQADPQSGVLGNLPRSRPPCAAPAAPRPRRRAAPESQPGRDCRERPGRAAEAAAQADLEALARGGLAVAGGAASLGLRIAGRAAAAVRDAVERR